MTRSILVGEVRTGRRIATIPVSDASWSLIKGGTGTVSADIPLGAQEFKEREHYWSGLFPGLTIYPSLSTYPSAATSTWRIGEGIQREFLTSLDPARCFMAAIDGDTVLEAGPIWPHDIPAGSNVLTVKADGLRSIFDARRVMGVIDSGYAAWGVTYKAMSLGTIAKRLVQLSLGQAGGNLPIVLPNDVLAIDDDDHRRTYKGSELASVNDRLKLLSGVLNGPDIEFRPRFTTDHQGIEWVMRTGTGADPMLHQPGADHVWDMRGNRGPLQGLAVSRDGGGMATRSWATGNDADLGMLMARVDDPDLTADGYPLLEIAESGSTVESQATVDGWAAGKAAGAARPTMNISASIRTDIPGAERVWPGDFGLLYPPAGHYLALLRPDSPYRVRVASMSGKLNDWAAMKFQPLMEAR